MERVGLIVWTEMLFITEQQVRENLPMPEAIRLMRDTFQALHTKTALNQPRRRLYLPTGTVLTSPVAKRPSPRALARASRSSASASIGEDFGATTTRRLLNRSKRVSARIAAPSPKRSQT